MKTSTESKFKTYHDLHCKHLKLKGVRPKTIQAYSRAIRRIGNYFYWRLDDLTQDELIDFFNRLLEYSA